MKSKSISYPTSKMLNAMYLAFTLGIASFLRAYAQDSALVTKTYLIKENIPLYEFKLFELGIDSISYQQEYEVQISNGKNIVQKIIASPIDEGTSIWLEDSLIDINFDGYNDFLIAVFSGEAGKNQFYDCWLFNTDSMKFIYNSDLSGLCNVSASASKKLIYELMFDGCASKCYDKLIFKVLNNKLLLIEKEDQFYDLHTGELRRILEYYENGELISKEEVEPIEY